MKSFLMMLPIVALAAPEPLRPIASQDPSTGTLNILILNPDLTPHPIALPHFSKINLESWSAQTPQQKRFLHTPSHTATTVTLPPMSVSVIQAR